MRGSFVSSQITRYPGTNSLSGLKAHHLSGLKAHRLSGLNAHHLRELKAHRQRAPGFTLIELLLVVAALAVALGISAAPFRDRVEDLRSASAMRALSSLFALARQEALIRQRPITVCAVTAQKRCNRIWTTDHSIVAFLDRNDDRRLDSGDALLREIRWPLKGGELSWRASLARNYLRFETNGGTWQNGTLYYCPRSRDARKARALVISHSGRNYMPGDSNGDGIREDRGGRNLRC